MRLPARTNSTISDQVSTRRDDEGDDAFDGGPVAWSSREYGRLAEMDVLTRSFLQRVVAVLIAIALGGFSMLSANGSIKS